MKSLIELNEELRRDIGEWVSDKSTLHNYLPVYDKLFTLYRDKEINFFEVGFWAGASCKLMELYFPKAIIRYIDNLKELRMDVLCKFDDPRVTLEYRDVMTLTAEYFNDFLPDIAIDDGSHQIDQQIYFIKTVFPILKSNGIMIIEDIQDIDNSKSRFEEINIPFEIIDLRTSGRWDDVLLIYRK
jgi:hypothetical protein